MNDKNVLPSLSMGMRSAVNLNSAALDTLLQTPALHALLDSFSEAIILCDGDSRVRFINLAAERLNKLARREAIGLSGSEFCQRSGFCLESLPQPEDGGPRHVTSQTEDGRDWITTGQPVPTGAREKPWLLVMQRDASRRDSRNPHRPPPASASATAVAREPMLHLSGRLAQIAATGVRAFQRRARLLLLGEPGVGKTAIARHIHQAAGWSGRPFIHVNCSSIPESLFESEMFGYERGAFTGALQGGKRGYIESAAGGTLFLDEIGEIPLHVQGKLLKFLEDSTIQSVGAPQAKTVQVQVVTATNQDLRGLVEAGRFRADLYYRLAVLPLDIPPLRHHREDLPVLIDVLLQRANHQRQPPLRLSSACRQRLLDYGYPGNIRELVNIFERLAVLADDEADESHLPPELLGLVDPLFSPSAAAPSALPEADEPTPDNLKARVQQFERQLIEQAVQELGSKRKAARHLNIDVGTLIRKLQRS